MEGHFLGLGLDTFTGSEVEHLLHEGAAADFAAEGDTTIRCTVTAETVGRTGVEMEALTAVQVGLLTIYDMCKAIDKGMTMEGIRLLEKEGGKSGHWKAAG